MSEQRPGTATSLLVCLLLFVALSSIVAADFSVETLRKSPIESLVLRKFAVAQRDLDRLGKCASSKQGAVDGVAIAIVAGEAGLRNSIEALLEQAYVGIAARLELPTMGLSLGPAQIGYEHYRSVRPSGRGYWDAVADHCGALAFVRRWLAAGEFDPTTTEGRRNAYSAWSGHATAVAEVDLNAASRGYFDYMERLHRAALASR